MRKTRFNKKLSILQNNKQATSSNLPLFNELGRKDLNPRMVESESTALPLGDAPLYSVFRRFSYLAWRLFNYIIVEYPCQHFFSLKSRFVNQVYLIPQFKFHKSNINKYEKLKPLKPVFCTSSIDLMHIKRYNNRCRSFNSVLT